MKKTIGLDVGQKRIGVALTEGEIISPYGVIEASDLTQSILEIGRIIREENVDLIVIGIPKHKDTLQVDKIHKFALELVKAVNLPIEYQDETLTSKESERILATSKLDPKSQQYKQEVDKLSAKLILEQHLNQ